jgi:SagB-type dehydrogenase family enzyme
MMLERDTDPDRGRRVTEADRKNLRTVVDYHERTKHQLDRYAASLGFMDWANQPDPFRTFAETDRIDLPHPELRKTPTFDDLLTESQPVVAPDADLIGRLFYHSLAISAWKKAAHTNPWSLRINPSSGDLHPTEGYLVSGPVPGLIDHPGVFHYAPFHHQLERRCRLTSRQWDRLTEGLPAPCLLVGLTSIYWRESWKYGERAFRYCHHDVGHAIGAIAFSARTLGWETRLLHSIADEDLNRLLGTHLQSGIEAEHADCLLLLFPMDRAPANPPALEQPPNEWHLRISDARFIGEPNRLSRDHHEWRVIEEVSLATRNGSARSQQSTTPSSARETALPALIPARRHPAEQIIRQRRSALDMDGVTSVDRSVFYQMLQRTLPGRFPFSALPWKPRVSLAIFVHRVENLAAGLYLLVRCESHEASLRSSLGSDFLWQRAEGCPEGLNLYCLLPADTTQAAKMVSCHQDIAGDGAFSLGMLAEFEEALAAEGAAAYPRLFWECGLIGQVLYLEAEAADVRSTGIGCFFDDAMHGILGIADHSWQSLYHFTVGGPVEDPRLQTIPPYAHLGRDK